MTMTDVKILVPTGRCLHSDRAWIAGEYRGEFLSKYSALFLQSEVTCNGTEYSSIDSQSPVARTLLIGV